MVLNIEEDSSTVKNHICFAYLPSLGQNSFLAARLFVCLIDCAYFCFLSSRSLCYLFSICLYQFINESNSLLRLSLILSDVRI